MDWAHELRCFSGGAFLTNAIPHFVVIAWVLLMALFAGRHFGRFNGGDSPVSKP